CVLDGDRLTKRFGLGSSHTPTIWGADYREFKLGLRKDYEERLPRSEPVLKVSQSRRGRWERPACFWGAVGGDALDPGVARISYVDVAGGRVNRYAFGADKLARTRTSTTP